MRPPIAPSPHPGADLAEVIEGALVREGILFTAGERVVLGRLLALDDAARELWARLSLRTGGASGGESGREPGREPGRGSGADLPVAGGRAASQGGPSVAGGPPGGAASPAGGDVLAEPIAGPPGPLPGARPGPPVFRVATLRYDLDVHGAVARLAAAGLAHTHLPDDRCVPAFDVPALKAACARLRLPVGGNRAALVERLRGRRWVDEPVVMLSHTGLVRRCELLWFQSPYTDRTSLVVERIGQLRWPTYAPTGGPGLFRDRAALRAYERARAGAWLDPDEPLAIVLAGRPDTGLSPWRRALEHLLATDPDADTLARLAAAGAPVRPLWALRLEREGRRAEALAVCRAGDPDPAVDVALERTGKRLARALGEGWAPRAPLRSAPTRRLRLPLGPKAGARPTWRVGGEVYPVEAAVLRVLDGAGRRALHAENWLWTSLYALVFRDLYFLPVPGMLPTGRRDGPLDVGTPGFYTRRREPVEARLAALAADGSGRFASGWQGERLAGLAAGEVVSGLCSAIPGKTAAAVLGRLAREGWAAARGLPDLYIFPGPATRIEGAVAARVEDRDLLVEIKGPTDALRDEQRVWHDRLLDQGIPVELWEVAG